ncbi:MAG: hypothetical protein ABWK01_08955 [Infirmifilum sp.]
MSGLMESSNVESYSTLKTVISHYLTKSFTGLSEQEADFMSDIATQDFLNYIAVEKDILYDSDSSLRVLSYISNLMEEKPLDLDKILSEWLEVWIIKWKQRVKLVMGEDSQDAKAMKNLEDKVTPIMNKLGDEVQAFRKFTIGSLIASREVCFTNLMADMVVKEILFKIASSQNIAEAQDFVRTNPVFILNEIVKRVKELSRFKGNLIVVKINPAFFQDVRGEIVEWW